MSGSPPVTRVVVVGAGPVGLMLACELRLGCTDVVVVEQLERPTGESRASTVHARTMELLDSRGLADELGTPPSAVLGHFGGINLDLSLPSSYPGLWKVPQARIEALLQRRAQSLGAVLRRGWRLVGLTDQGDHVEVSVETPTGRERLRAAYLVACDGADSTVRKLTGVDFPGRTATRELLRADVAGIDVPNRRFERLAAGLAIAARQPDGTTRVMVHEFGAQASARSGPPTFADVAMTWKRVTGEDISGGTPLWVNAFGDANRQLRRYRHGRILFAGDAAHQQMPIGGQAMNLGLQDAMNLGWKLARHLGPLPPDGLLDTYHAERHAVGVGVLNNIAAQASLLLGGAEVEPVRALLTELMTIDRVRERLAGMISGLDVRYDVGGGHSMLGASGDHPMLGARLPATQLVGPGFRTGTEILLRSGRGLLLDLTGGRPDRVRRVCAPWHDRVTAVAARPAEHGSLTGVEHVLVRPDGYVAWVGPTLSHAGAALERWFGPPGPISPEGTDVDREDPYGN